MEYELHDSFNCRKVCSAVVVVEMVVLIGSVVAVVEVLVVGGSVVVVVSEFVVAGGSIVLAVVVAVVEELV